MSRFHFAPPSFIRNVPCLIVLLTVLGIASSVTHAQDASFVNWENLPLHAVDLSPDGGTLAVVN